MPSCHGQVPQVDEKIHGPSCKRRRQEESSLSWQKPH